MFEEYLRRAQKTWGQALTSWRKLKYPDIELENSIQSETDSNAGKIKAISKELYNTIRKYF